MNESIGNFDDGRSDFRMCRCVVWNLDFVESRLHDSLTY
jgi:hypothetical protein